VTTPIGEVLIVEDSAPNLRLLVDTLTTAGYVARPANSGELALASVAAKAPDLILLDICMPGMDGFEVFRRLRAQAGSHDVPVIFISGVTEVEARIEGLKQGAVDFVVKPFCGEELLARVHTHVQLRHLQLRRERDATELKRANDALQAEIAVRRRAEAENERLIAELKAALADVKALSGILPICAFCKKIRDDQGYWSHVESYISKHSIAQFSHSLCPECLKQQYPDFADEPD
jgi:DNA-binding response OmpR family regulator